MAEEQSLSRKRWARSGWLIAIVIAITTLALPHFGSHQKGSHQIGLKAQGFTGQIHETMYAKKSLPLRIMIPSIGVDSKIIQLGLEKDGSLAVPPDGSTAGWYKGSPTPGEIGPSVVAGHVDWKGKKGVFFNLRLLKVGAFVQILRADGKSQTFTVEKVQAFAKNHFPSRQVYGDIPYSGLRLITCGDFNYQLKRYVNDIVVFAKAIP